MAHATEIRERAEIKGGELLREIKDAVGRLSGGQRTPKSRPRTDLTEAEARSIRRVAVATHSHECGAGASL
jgi:hypothetical protein